MDKTTNCTSLKLSVVLLFSIFLSSAAQANDDVMAVGELKHDLTDIENRIFESENWNLILPDIAFNAKRGAEFLYCSIVGDILEDSSAAKKNYERGMAFLDDYTQQVITDTSIPKKSALIDQIGFSFANYQYVENKNVLKGMIYQNLADQVLGGWIQFGEGKEASKKRFQVSYSKYCHSL